MAEELFEHFKFVADKGQGPVRVDKFLVDRIVGTSRNRIQRAADGGFIPDRDQFRHSCLDRGGDDDTLPYERG